MLLLSENKTMNGLLYALEGAKLQDIPQHADEVIDELRAETIKIQYAAKKAETGEMVSPNQIKQWSEIVADTMFVVGVMEERLVALFLPLDEHIPLNNTLLHIRQVLTTFNTAMCDLVGTVLRHGRRSAF
jgi:hypothetical protein